MRNSNHRRTNKVITYNIPQIVTVRKYVVDIEGLKQILKSHKKLKKLNNSQIADILHQPKTKVDHWFRNDKCFAIPDADIWFELKNLLDIKTDKYDISIMTFEERLGVFDTNNRVYDVRGLAPTVTTMGDIKILITGDNSEDLHI